MPLAPLFAERYYENRELVANAVHILQVQVLPARCNLGAIRYDITLQTASAMKDDEMTAVQLGAFWIPLFNDDAAATPPNRAAAVTLFNRAVPKISDYPTESMIDSTDASDLWTPANADYTVGDIDTALIWQPGKIPLSVLTNPVSAAEIFRMREWVGWSEGNCFRVGALDGTDGDAHAYVRGQLKSKGIIRRGITPSTPGMIMWYLNIPTIPDDGWWDDWDRLMPRQGLFETLNFLAPEVDRVSGNNIIYPSSDDDWLRWTYAAETTGTRQWIAANWDVRMHLFYHHSRAPIGMAVDGADKVQ